MHRVGIATAAILSLGLTSSCQKDESKTHALLQELVDGQKQLIEAVKAGGGGAAAGRRAPQRRPRPRPSPTDVFSVGVAGAPVVGSKDAKVTVVKAFEFACPFCERARPTMDTLLKDYGDDVRIAYKHYVVHPQSATIPAQAACAAHKQGKFKEMYDGIWDKGFKASRNLSQENMEKIAKSIGLNLSKFKTDMDGECKAQIRKDQAEMARIGVTGTPAFYINGRFLSGARPVDQFKRIIDEELKKANERIQKGEASASNYYDKFVVEKGKKRFDANAK